MGGGGGGCITNNFNPIPDGGRTISILPDAVTS